MLSKTTITTQFKNMQKNSKQWNSLTGISFSRKCDLKKNVY